MINIDDIKLKFPDGEISVQNVVNDYEILKKNLGITDEDIYKMSFIERRKLVEKHEKSIHNWK